MEEKSVFPSVELLTSIEQLVLDEKIARTDDPYAFLQTEAPETGSKAKEIRDKNFRVLKPLIEEPFFYVPKIWTKVLNEILKTEDISKPYLDRIARQFWQRGQIPNALLPDYRNSGAKGKRRIAKDKKLGRPRVHLEGTGALIDESTEKLFRIVIDKYLLEENRIDVPFVHRQLKRLYNQYFPDTPESEKPTKWQLQHFYNREYGLTEKIIKRTSDLIYKKDVRPLTGTATMHVLFVAQRDRLHITRLYIMAEFVLSTTKDQNRRWTTYNHNLARRLGKW